MYCNKNVSHILFEIITRAKRKLAKAFSANEGVTLRLKHENLWGSEELFLTKTNKYGEEEPRGEKGNRSQDIQTQMRKVIPRGGNLFSSSICLARPHIKPSLGALASGGLRFGVEKALKGIFESGYGPKETKQNIKLKELLKMCLPHNFKTLTQQYGTGSTQKSGFLDALTAWIGIPMVIDLVKKLIGG